MSKKFVAGSAGEKTIVPLLHNVEAGEQGRRRVGSDWRFTNANQLKHKLLINCNQRQATHQREAQRPAAGSRRTLQYMDGSTQEYQYAVARAHVGATVRSPVQHVCQPCSKGVEAQGVWTGASSFQR